MNWWNSLKLRSKHPEVRLKVIESLHEKANADSGTFSLLAAGLKDENVQVRCAAARILGQVKDERSADLLIPLLSDTSMEARLGGATALGHLGDARAVDSLNERSVKRRNAR